MSTRSVSRCEETETYSPRAIDTAPAIVEAKPAPNTTVSLAPVAITPSSSAAMETIPSLAPSTPARRVFIRLWWLGTCGSCRGVSGVSGDDHQSFIGAGDPISTAYQGPSFPTTKRSQPSPSFGANLFVDTSRYSPGDLLERGLRPRDARRGTYSRSSMR